MVELTQARYGEVEAGPFSLMAVIKVTHHLALLLDRITCRRWCLTEQGRHFDFHYLFTQLIMSALIGGFAEPAIELEGLGEIAMLLRSKLGSLIFDGFFPGRLLFQQKVEFFLSGSLLLKPDIRVIMKEGVPSTKALYLSFGGFIGHRPQGCLIGFSVVHPTGGH